tara:strand:- start:6631 stop:7599 length:969 start_codon:yes stop_codon:yes gene_type:complete
MTYKVQQRLDAINTILNNRTHLSNDGVNLNIWCPFCKNPNKNKKKLSIHLEKSFYHCWICDKKGSNLNFLFKKLGKQIPSEFSSLFVNYKKKFSLFDDEEVEEQIILNEPQGFNFIVENYNTKNPDNRDVIKYAIKRGFSKKKLFLLRPGFSSSPEFSRYLILPSYDKCGNINYYTGRKIDASTNDSFKYRNAPVTKSKIIFNELNIDWSKDLTLVEGPLDLIKTNDNATCLLGSSLTEDMLLFQKIVANRTNIKLALDSDIFSKSLKIASLLHSYDINVEIVDTRGYEDVGDMSHKKFMELYNSAKEYTENDSLLNKIRLL